MKLVNNCKQAVTSNAHNKPILSMMRMIYKLVKLTNEYGKRNHISEQ